MTADYADLVADVGRQRTVLARRQGQAEQVDAQIRALEDELENLLGQAEQLSRVGAMFTTVGEAAQEIARDRVEQLATKALQVIFGDEHQFLLVPGERGGQATLELKVRSSYPDGKVVETGVMEARGGGMAAVVGYVLRLVVLLLTPEIRNLLFLDETFAFVSADYEGRVAEFIRQVADKARVQHVIITHSPAYAEAADAVSRLELGADGVTVVHRGGG